MKLIYFLCNILLFINVSNATLFVPLSFEKQVEEANSAAEVKLDNSRSFRDERGMIMTEYRFNISESYNLAAEELDGGQLVITMLGGTVDGVTTSIDGAPKFEAGKRNFLLLKKIQSKFYLSNFTLGQYEIVIADGKEMLVSEVFPLDPKVGRIAKDKLVEIIKEKWKISSTLESKSSLVIANLDEKKVNERAESAKIEARSPAQDESTPEGTPLFFWWALAFVTGFFSLFFIKLNTHKVEAKK